MISVLTPHSSIDRLENDFSQNNSSLSASWPEGNGIDRTEWISSIPAATLFQPIFYPVLNEEYATQIARDWNTKDEASGFAGYVTRFAVAVDFLDKYEIQTVGSAAVHQEYWIPSEHLDAFNKSIVGTIEVIAKFTRE